MTNFQSIAKSLRETIPTHLREFFKEHWNRKYPGKVWKSDETSGRDLCKEIPYKIRNYKRFKKYKKFLKSGNEKDWDFDVLVFVILHSGISFLEPCRPNNQRSLPLFISEQIERIIKIKDKYLSSIAQLSSMRCSSDDFQKTMTDLKSIAKDIFQGDALKELEEIECAQWHKESKAINTPINVANDADGNL